MKGVKADAAGGADPRKWAREGVERHGPVTSEPPTYPSNREVPRAAELDEAGASAVLTARLLANHWRTGECSIGERRSKLEGRNYGTGSCACSCDYEAQKEAIVSYCGEAFFPAELLHSRFVRVPRGAPRGLPGDSKRLRLKEMEQKENENKAADDKANANAKAAAEEELFAAEEDDFGGDDYAHDYYADEDLDDHLDDGDDGGIL
ncbi:hypothetical protein, conserved [Eimeria necatrix]|uniref:DNA-directed RNA polymerase III subunit n=1 Tax=Eimeria necatrix TaxID=51315 RepID=U6MQD8_9EIME|nr:hypothetical protein, conserved [Eimeria necatrix]CDJ65293.1 hypothetical protein, conserved [Eimeria necatrix]